MTLDVVVGGKTRRVELNRIADRWSALVDGRECRFDVAQIAAGRMSIVLESGRSVDVGIEDRGRGELIVHVDGVSVPVSTIDPRRAFGRGAGEHGRTGGPASITAPMPGRIVKVLVRPGDQVTARQGLVVVEAMKMENELRAPADARVVEVRAVEGTSVDANAVLVVLE